MKEMHIQTYNNTFGPIDGCSSLFKEQLTQMRSVFSCQELAQVLSDYFTL